MTKSFKIFLIILSIFLYYFVIGFFKFSFLMSRLMSRIPSVIIWLPLLVFGVRNLLRISRQKSSSVIREKRSVGVTVYGWLEILVSLYYIYAANKMLNHPALGLAFPICLIFEIFSFAMLYAGVLFLKLEEAGRTLSGLLFAVIALWSIYVSFLGIALLLNKMESFVGTTIEDWGYRKLLFDVAMAIFSTSFVCFLTRSKVKQQFME